MNSEELTKTQNRLFQMGLQITKIFEDNDIEYMLAYGTLLGAVRHKNFIPWDDDFDLWIFSKDYKKGIEVLKKELPNDMFVEDEETEPLYFHSWTHVKDIHSIAECEQFPQDSCYAHKGISIDLYRLEEMPFSNLEDYLIKENKEYLDRRKKFNLISDEEYNNRLENTNIKIKESKDKLNLIYALVSPYKCKYLLSTDIMPIKKIEFNNHSFHCPAKPEKILSDIYGDYLTPPPLSERKQHYSKVIFM